MTYQIANMSTISNETKSAVTEELLQLHEAQQYLMHGGDQLRQEI